MTLRIEKYSEGEETVFRLSGRIRPEGIVELERQLKGVLGKVVLDVKEVTLVDLDVVHFLGVCVSNGMELRNCAPYILEWIRRER
jgi:hypothetical protein